MSTFAGVATPAGICIQTSQDTIMAELDKVTALIPDITADPAVSATTPDFDKWPPELATQMRLEMAALRAAIDAMAVA